MSSVQDLPIVEQIVQAMGSQAHPHVALAQAQPQFQQTGGYQPNFNLGAQGMLADAIQPGPDLGMQAGGQPTPPNINLQSIGGQSLLQSPPTQYGMTGGLPPEHEAAVGDVLAQQAGAKAPDEQMQLLMQLLKPQEPTWGQALIAGVGDALAQSQAGIIPPRGPGIWESLMHQQQQQQTQKMQTILLAQKLGLIQTPGSDLDIEAKKALIDLRKAQAEKARAGGAGKLYKADVMPSPEEAQQFNVDPRKPVTRIYDSTGKAVQVFTAPPKDMQPNLHFMPDGYGNVLGMNAKTGQIESKTKMDTKLSAAENTEKQMNAHVHQTLNTAYKVIDHYGSDISQNRMTALLEARDHPETVGRVVSPTRSEAKVMQAYGDIRANIPTLFTDTGGKLNEKQTEEALKPFNSPDVGVWKDAIKSQVNAVADKQARLIESARSAGHATTSIKRLHYVKKDGTKSVPKPDESTVPRMLGGEPTAKSSREASPRIEPKSLFDEYGYQAPGR